MLQRIVVINGPAAVGKDLFASLCSKFALTKGISPYNISTVDAVKSALFALGWSGEKNDHTREIMFDLKKFSTELFNDFPNKYVIMMVNYLYDKNAAAIEKYYQSINTEIDNVRCAMRNLGMPPQENPQEFPELYAYLQKLKGPEFNAFFKRRRIFNKVKADESNNKQLFFTHMREPDNIRSFVNALAALNKEVQTLYITRNNTHIPQNGADLYTANYPYKHYIKNDEGILELENKAQEFVSKIFA